MKIVPMLVTYLDHMGTDLTVVDAARVSMAKESEWGTVERYTYADQDFPEVEEVLKDADVKLITYLAEHSHWTPFSHPQISFRIKAPIFVARQWFKHMVGITRNEQSRRYVDEEPEFYFPEVWRGRPEGSIKQGSSGEVDEITLDNMTCITGMDGTYPISDYADLTASYALALYKDMLTSGVAPEQARMILPQNMMTEWVETGSLAAVCRACKLRLDPHAQQETREIAEQIAEIVAPLFPVSWAALMDKE